MTRLSLVSNISLVLLLRDCVEGFRHILAPIQPVFSLAASPHGDKVTSKSKVQPTFVDFEGGTLEFSWHKSIADIPANVWDGCLPGPDNSTKPSPFLEHSWLRCLEATECVSETTGWTPQHLSIHIHPKTNTSSNPIKQRKKIKPKPTVLMDGCVPAYIKTHSMGEFIFDESWADAAFRSGLDYYPKLLIGVPFTPVTGPRILWHSQVWTTMSSEAVDELNGAVAKFLKQSASARGWSSVHINFCTDQEATAIAGPLETSGRNGNSSNATNGEMGAENESIDMVDDAIQKLGTNGDTEKDIRQQLKGLLHQQLKTIDTNSYLRRTSLQYQWKNRNPQRGGKPYQDFEDYLSCFRSKRRITVRRERQKARLDNKLRIDAIRGEDILKVDGLVERMFEIYLSTVDKMFWGRQYLTLEFFEMVCRTPFVNNLCFFCVHNDRSENNFAALKNGKSDCWGAEDVFAGTINVVKDGVFYGRYWGCLPGHEVKNLHFETCYWSAIEYCIENGLDRMEPGAGGADYKWARGFDAHFGHSVHYICNPLLRTAVSQFLETETEYNLALKTHLRGKSAVAERENNDL